MVARAPAPRATGGVLGQDLLALKGCGLHVRLSGRASAPLLLLKHEHREEAESAWQRL